jgi:hypothetical protein
MASLLVARAQYPKAPPLAELDQPNAYRLKDLDLGSGNTNGTFVFLALSGGGTRAAAFSYGAMRALAEAPLANGESVLLDEVDVISSVSGGSFASACWRPGTGGSSAHGGMAGRISRPSTTTVSSGASRTEISRESALWC